MDIGLREVGGQTLRVGVRPGDKSRPPLLLFNGIGANIELVEPFLETLDGLEAIIFDVPGVGGSPAPRMPYRPWHLVRLSARLLDQLGHDRVDVLGVSWGGAIAQQFAFQQAKRCRRLVLAATSPGPPHGAGKACRAPQDGESPPLPGSCVHGQNSGRHLWRPNAQLARTRAKTHAPCPRVKRLWLLPAADGVCRLDQLTLVAFSSSADACHGGKRRSDRATCRTVASWPSSFRTRPW